MMSNGIKNLSIILNAVDSENGGYGYGGAYGYGGYYEDEPDHEKSVFKNIFGRKK